MTSQPLISQQFKSANRFLWVIKTYLDLISKDDQLIYGIGLKRLFVMKSGVATFNDGDIQAITDKAETLKLIPYNLTTFMTSSIIKNIELYGKELQRLIQRRIVNISTGEVRNPDPLFKFSAEEARRYYYIPPITYVQRLQQALAEDVDLRGRYSFSPPAVVTLQDIANDGDILLTRMQISEGHLAPMETSWGALVKVIEQLIDILESESRYGFKDQDYKLRSRSALKILWFIGKLLLGDLSPSPARRDLNLVDLDSKLNFTDGTLAAIPFPLPQTMEIFSDFDGQNKTGISTKGRIYLSAVAAAAFYQSELDDNVD